MHQNEFIDALGQDGFEAAVTVSREPDGFIDVHVHPFEARALVIAGGLRIRAGDTERDYAVGDIFHLQANESHSERYGPDGVTYLVGRK